MIKAIRNNFESIRVNKSLLCQGDMNHPITRLGTVSALANMTIKLCEVCYEKAPKNHKECIDKIAQEIESKKVSDNDIKYGYKKM